MLRKQSAQSARRSLFRPHLQPLEDRALPSCVVFVRDDTLIIRGDSLANDVQLVAQGALVTVACDNDPAVTYDGIRQITADLGGGNDRFVANRLSPAGSQNFASAPFALRLSTGAGEDIANLDWVPGGQDSIWIDLGGGADVFTAQFIPPPDPDIPPPDPDVPDPLTVRLTVQGGPAIDRITSRMGIQPTPFMPSVIFDVNVDGGAGDDFVMAEAIVLPATQQGSNLPPVPPSARFDMTLNGGHGDDEITARMGIQPTPFLPLVDFNLDADGGAGDDAVAVNTNVDPSLIVGFNPQPEPPVVRLNLATRGGSGLDRITSRMGIQPTPFLPPVVACTLSMDGGVGDDVLDAQFESDATAQNVADLRVALLGGGGDDALSLLWTAGAFDVDAFADGGAGIDLGVFSPGVRHVNVERFG